MFAEGFAGELGLLHHVERLVERTGERLDPKGATLAVGELEEVGVGLGRKLVALVDAAEPAARISEKARYGLAAPSSAPYSMRADSGLPFLRTGTRIMAERLLRAQAT